ncbi:acireductone synthase [Leptospira sp. 96542]|nr:acireductone synthase [Leptospira sp. 96542]
MFKHFLFDIEGTTAPISFVHQVLFPYAKKNLETHLQTFEFNKSELEQIQAEFEKDKLANENKFSQIFEKEEGDQILKNDNSSKEQIRKYFDYLIQVDRKFGPLKEIQGKIWKMGYESNEIKSIIFSDVPEFLEKAIELGIQNHVYSSGSVEAQVLIYQYSELGDLRNFFTSYFDTAIGGKREKESYLNISSQLKSDPSEIRFFTDIVEEAEAAKEAGFDVVILDRPGNIPQKEHSFTVWENFSNKPM